MSMIQRLCHVVLVVDAGVLKVSRLVFPIETLVCLYMCLTLLSGPSVQIPCVCMYSMLDLFSAR